MNVIRVSFLLLVLLSLVAVDCVRAGDESKEGEGAGEGPPKEEQDADVEVGICGANILSEILLGSE